MNAAEIAAQAKDKVRLQAQQVLQQPATQPTSNNGDPMAVLAGALRPYLGLSIDAATVKKEIERIARELTPLPTVVELVDQQTRETIATEKVHKAFPMFFELLQADLKPFLVGPAGSFKTSSARKAAELLGYSDDMIIIQSVSMATTEGKLLGFVDAHGKTVSTGFRKAWEEGGFYFMDEIDAGSANSLAVLNAAIDSEWCGFPDGMVKRHEKFRFACAANTYGKGADRQYVGRNKLDAATLNRLVAIEWEYDEELEREIAGADVAHWVKRVQEVRAATMAAKVEHLVSPRQTFKGAAMLRAGWPLAKCEEVFLWAGLTRDAKEAIQAQLEKRRN